MYLVNLSYCGGGERENGNDGLDEVGGEHGCKSSVPNEVQVDCSIF